MATSPRAAPSRARAPLPVWEPLGGDGASVAHAGDGASLTVAAPTTAAPRRIENLDLLRAVAILAVLADNAVGEGVVDAGAWLNHVITTGWVGVDLFFVLSGWLIGGLYWRELNRFGSVQVGRFWSRRWLRTIPPYLVAFGVIAGVRLAMGFGDDPGDLWRYLTFTQNYAMPIPFWGVSWSLAVEEHFYLALPLVLGLALRVRGGVPLALGAAALASLLTRVLIVPDGAWAWGLQYTATHMRLEGLALGVAASYVYHQRPALWPALQRTGRWMLVPGLAFVVSIPWLPTDVVNRWAYAGVDLAFLAVLVSVVDRRALPLAGSRAIRWIALVSYSLYMTHTVVFDAVARTLPGLSPMLRLAVALAAVGVVGGAFYGAVERPSLWLRKRIAPRRSGAASPALGRPS